MIETGKPIFFIDTNILVYSIDASEKEKQPKAKQLIQKVWNREVIYVVSTQILAEFFFVVTKKMPFPLKIEQAQQIIEDIFIFPSWKVVSYNQNILKRSLKLYQEQKKHFWDLVIIATMLEHKITHLYTENEKDFEGFENITAINPLKHISAF